jgi:hypothetical protein
VRSTRPLVAGLLAVLSACASTPEPTREEYLSRTTRTYDQSRETVIAAAERVLRLADGDHFTFQHRYEGFTATRRWLIFAVIMAVTGNDYWSVTVTEEPTGSRIHVDVGQVENATGMMPTVGGTPGAPPSYGVASFPGNAKPLTSAALYGLFFDRMDYMLGLRADWPTCAAVLMAQRGTVSWHGEDAICNPVNMTDSTPTGPIVAPKQ